MSHLSYCLGLSYYWPHIVFCMFVFLVFVRITLGGNYMDNRGLYIIPRDPQTRRRNLSNKDVFVSCMCWFYSHPDKHSFSLDSISVPCLHVSVPQSSSHPSDPRYRDPVACTTNSASACTQTHAPLRERGPPPPPPPPLPLCGRAEAKYLPVECVRRLCGPLCVTRRRQTAGFGKWTGLTGLSPSLKVWLEAVPGLGRAGRC